MEIAFSSKEELFKRIMPALKAKRSEFIRFGYSFIHEVDIWNYLIKNTWSTARDLTLADIVSDIMQVEAAKIEKFLKQEHENQESVANIEII